MQTQAKNSGFTLIELMITVLLLSIVLAIAAPNFISWINNSRVKSTTENMAQDLIMARTEAIRRNKPTRLDVRSNCYGITIKNTACNCSITDTSNSAYCEIKQVSTTAGTELTVDTGHFNSLIFDSIRGMPATSSFGTLSSEQNVSISNSSYTAKLKLNIIGNVCISSPSGANKLTSYPDAC
ncbi:GspH/FimT family pseudopilin [uncultured Deefgea sp.]|uniref:GspH/FimT family pseudopilin n=1 Tax=uncultured Deefgea sp. TaxID=1304914 RepID=UPI00259395D9|nr:GspH/FimT family pseudopilin [uncultured Deefgea sp.]